MSDQLVIATITYLPAILVALTGLLVAMGNTRHLARVDNAMKAVETTSNANTISVADVTAKQNALHPGATA